MKNSWLSQLQKLRVTRKQWRSFLKWAMYALLLIVTIVVQGVILSRLPLLGAKVNLVPYYVGTVCIIEGADRGSVFALLASLMWALSGGDLGFVSIVVLTGGCMGVGLLTRSYLRRHLLTCTLCCLALSLCNESAIFLLRLFLHTVTARQYLRIALPGVILGAISCPIFFYLFRAIHRIGGEREWNE